MAKKINIDLPRLDQLSIEIKSHGDWSKVEYGVSNLSKDISKGYEDAVGAFSGHLLKIVKRSISTGTPPPNSGITWEPLSPATIRRWGPHPIYNLTGLYHRSVGLFRYKSRVLVGMPIGESRSSQGKLTLNQLAKILEFGTKDERIPPRPLWSPALKSVGGIKKLKQQILTNIRSNLGKSFGIRPNQVRW